jgi:hypothetical protein
VMINSVDTTMQLLSPQNPTTILNNQFLASGAFNTARIAPLNAGFGAATGAMPMRTLQLTLRFTF